METNIPYQVIKDICQGKRDIDKEVGHKLSSYFQVSKNYWVNFQSHYNSVNNQEEKEIEIIEAQELEKNKSCQITLRADYKELKKIFANQWNEVRAMMKTKGIKTRTKYLY